MSIKTEHSDNKANWSYLEIVIKSFMDLLYGFSSSEFVSCEDKMSMWNYVIKRDYFNTIHRNTNLVHHGRI